MKNTDNTEPRMALLIDCDNVSAEILEYALKVAAQFGRIVMRHGYGNLATLSNKWQTTMVQKAFTPCLQYQYAPGKNTSDMALALDAQEALFDERIDIFCLVTSDSDFTCLCRKLRERGAMVYIVGEAKTPQALRNACDQFFEWKQETESQMTTEAQGKVAGSKPQAKTKAQANATGKSATAPSKTSKPPDTKECPPLVMEAISQLVSDSGGEEVSLSKLGEYLRRVDPGFSPKNHGHANLLNMLKSTVLATVEEKNGTHWVKLTEKVKKNLPPTVAP
jgi:uncharacterized protein (TIGR00288 family)